MGVMQLIYGAFNHNFVFYNYSLREEVLQKVIIHNALFVMDRVKFF